MNAERLVAAAIRGGIDSPAARALVDILDAAEEAGRAASTLASRHWFAGIVLEATHGDLRAAQAYLGHESVRTTIDRYGGIADAAKRRAAVSMDAMLDRAKVRDGTT